MSSELQQQATRTILSHAIFRLESAIIIGLTIVLVFLFPHPFPWWQWWMWLSLGIVAEALIIYTSVTDPVTGRRVIAAMLRQQFNPRVLRSPRARAWMDQALEYREQIEEAIRQRRGGALKAHLRETTGRVDDWLAHIFNLAQRVDGRRMIPRYESRCRR
jgi:hypothetical protein